jgi:DNA mismatch repair protein MutL
VRRVGRIRVLERNTVDRIAAGEVVERPASVVKELVENSLDAGAGAIEVRLEDGGKRSVSVRDDGCGMPPDDVHMAAESHSTSKIAGIDDLQRLQTYGFRGEALSSIASVAKLTIRSKEHGRTEGFEEVIEDGARVRSTAVGCPEGTEVVVEGLFQSVPARMKQLKSSSVEMSHCVEVVTDFVLCRPAISFRLFSGGDLVLVHAADEGMEGSLSLAFGHKVAADMLSGQAEADGVRVEAHLARLEHTRSSPSDLRIFVNHRPVRSRRIVSAAVKAFGSRIMKDRYPVGVLKVLVDGSAVDVNVHPTKREVRFDDERLVIGAVERSVADAVEGPDLSFRYDLTRFSEKFEPDVPASFVARSEAAQSQLEVASDGADSQGPHGIRPLAQIMDTYILAESGGNLLLIDQHAASERVVYERVLAAVDEGREISQELLTPMVLALTPTEAKTLGENIDMLSKAGFRIDPFGGGSYSVRSVPTVLGLAQGERVIRDILADLADFSAPKRMGQEFIWRVACHTSIRAGEKLSHAQMRQLVSELAGTESPHTCEHGRPTMIVLAPSDLEKLFKRRV